MIGWLSGRLLRKEASRVLVETGGVGYELHIPFSTFFALGAVGAQVALHVHTHVREDALQLFGFASEEELAVFRHLIAVSGIGPRMAATILSGARPDELADAIRGSDVRRLTAIPGVGKKTAERLVVELKDKLPDLGASLPARTPVPAAAGLREDAASALVNLGWRRREAEAAVDRVAGPDTGDLEKLLKAALAVLAR